MRPAFPPLWAAHIRGLRLYWGVGGPHFHYLCDLQGRRLAPVAGGSEASAVGFFFFFFQEPVFHWRDHRGRVLHKEGLVSVSFPPRRLSRACLTQGRMGGRVFLTQETTMGVSHIRKGHQEDGRVSRKEGWGG